jgi:hypothetical protein
MLLDLMKRKSFAVMRARRTLLRSNSPRSIATEKRTENRHRKEFCLSS